MSLLAGFDLVVEISNETLLKSIESSFKIGGVFAKPPFEIAIPISDTGFDGSAHFVVTDIQLDLNADDTLSLALAFDRGSIEIASVITICPLDGTIDVEASITLQTAADQTQALAFGITNATINWSSDANQAITASLAGTPITPALFDGFAVTAIQTFVLSQPAPTFPTAIKVTPGMDGSITPGLVFEHIEVHCIANPVRGMQALALFGILLKQNDANGDHSQKTVTAITSPSDGMCISISPPAFNRLVFCPGLATDLGTSVAMLPTTCGAGPGLDTQGVTITKITDAFANGHIDIMSTASKAGFCYTASANFHSTLTLFVTDGTLNARISTDTPNINATLTGFCWAIGAVAAGPLVIAIGAALSPIISASGPLMNLGSMLSGSLALGGLSSSTTIGVPVRLTDVAVTTEGVTLEGIVPLSIYVSGQPAVDIGGSVTTSTSAVIGEGVFHTQVWCDLPKDYPYTEYSQQQQGTYRVTASLAQQPLSVSVTLNTGTGPDIPLGVGAGTVEVPDVETHYPMPLASGGSVVMQAVHIDYQIDGSSVSLGNHFEDGNYGVWLNVAVMGCGRPIVGYDGQPVQKSVWVQFEGDHVDIGGGFEADVQHCAQQLKSFLQKRLFDNKAWQPVPRWVEINYPPPELLVAYVQQLMALGLPELDDVLRTVKIAHGNSFTRALFSASATQIDTLATERDVQSTAVTPI